MNREHDEEIDDLEREEELEETEETEDIDDGDEDGTGDDADDSTAEDEDDTEDEDAGDGVATGANKRIRQLNEQKNQAESKVKELEKELENAKKMSGEDGALFLSAAKKAGVLPELMTKAEADAFHQMETIPDVIEHYEQWLDESDAEDDFDCGNGKTMTRSQVKARVRELNREQAKLERTYGSRREALQSEVEKIYKLGVAAKKAGWTPAGGKSSKTKTVPKKLHDNPSRTSTKPKPKVTEDADIDVSDGDSFEAFIVAENKKKRKK